jgi:hypothetical protein
VTRPRSPRRWADMQSLPSTVRNMRTPSNLKTSLPDETSREKAGHGRVRFRAALMTAVVIVGFTQAPACAVTTGSAQEQLRTIASASHPGSAAWTLEVRPGWSHGGVRVDGRDGAIRVVHNDTGATTWNLEGQSPLAQLRAGRVPKTVLQDARAPRAKWVRISDERDVYALHEPVTRTDATIRPDQVALWLSTRVGLAHTGSSYHSEVPAGSLPTGVADLFFDDGNTPVSVRIDVKAGRVTGYRLYQRSSYGDERGLDAQLVSTPRRVYAPTRTSIVDHDVLVDALERAADPRTALAALPADVSTYDRKDLIAAIGRRNDAVPNLVVAPTKSGVALFPELISQQTTLSAVVCVDLPSSRPSPRPCTAADRAALSERLEPYASWLQEIATMTELSDEQIFWALDSLNHNLWLYSGMALDEAEIAAWRWFHLDTFTRPMTVRDRIRYGVEVV